MDDADFGHIKLDRDGSLWCVTLDRPDVRNAHDTRTFREIVAAFDLAERDPACRCVVLTGAGEIFSSGQDLAFTRNASAADADEYGRWNVAARQRIQRNHKPVIAAVNGPAIGGGTYLATACDYVVALDTAWFQMREIHAGNHAGGHALFTVGRARSLEMTLLGRRISAAKALDWGLINETASAADFQTAVAVVAAEFLALPPLAVRYTKASTNILLDAAGFSTHLDANGPMQRYLSLSPDGREAKAAFMEKRTADFTGELPEPQT